MCRVSRSKTPGSATNYDGRAGANEPDCSPHPFDTLAIYALYQTEPAVSISGPAWGNEGTEIELTEEVAKLTSPYTYEWSMEPPWDHLKFLLTTTQVPSP